MPRNNYRRVAAVTAFGCLAALGSVSIAHADSPAGQHMIAISKVPDGIRCVKIERANNLQPSQQSTVLLKNLSPGSVVKTTTHVDNDSTPDVTFYTSSDCTSGDVSSGFIDVNPDSLTYVWISWANYHPYYGWVNLAPS